MQSFTYVNCNIFLGIDESNSKLFGIWVTYENFDGAVFTPTIGFPHTIIKKFSAQVPRKSLFGILITSLRDAEIIPLNGFNHPKNPDNQYYIELPCSKLEAAIKIIRLRLGGVASFDTTKDLPTPIFSESEQLATTHEKNIDEYGDYGESDVPSCVTLSKKKAPLLEVWDDTQ